MLRRMHLSANIIEIKGQLTRQSVIASQKVSGECLLL